MSRKIIIPKSRLRFLYTERKFSARRIANIFNCEQTAILNRLREYNIPIKYLKKKVIVSKKQLEDLYIKKGLSTYKVAEKFNCTSGTIYRNLKLHKIKTRPLKRLNLTKKELEELYINKRFSLSRIAKVYKCSASGILKKMRQYKIPSRDLSEANTKHVKTDFNGSNIEKAYILGFRIGDLGVREEKNLVKIGCGTTKSAQIKLIKDLFNKYGPIWISKTDRRGAKHIDCSLNSSFKFLLTKHKSIPNWILKNNKNFFSFLAGYTDAEGNIGVCDSRARFRIRSYDKGILRDIDTKLKLFSIRSLFSLDKEAHIDKGGVRHNKDSWQVVINEKESLLRIFNKIGFLLRHQKRKRNLLKAKKNVILRLRNKY